MKAYISKSHNYPLHALFYSKQSALQVIRCLRRLYYLLHALFYPKQSVLQVIRCLRWLYYLLYALFYPKQSVKQVIESVASKQNRLPRGEPVVILLRYRSGSDDLVSAVETVPLHCFLSHLVLEDLSCCIHREAVNKVNVSRNLVLSHVIHDILLDLIFR